MRVGARWAWAVSASLWLLLWMPLVPFAVDVLAADSHLASASSPADAATAPLPLGFRLPLYTMVPFALLLLSIAVLPLAAHHWWGRLRHQALIVLVLSIPVAIFLGLEAPHALAHSMIEYLAFLALLGSLYTVSGGILLTGDLRATPAVNTAFLGAGAILANLVGTTGASMLLIRPLLQTNEERRKTRHIPIFFVFLVSNIGGCLTPLADPPLFLGYLRGVPFSWTLRLFPEWLFMSGLLLVSFYALDTWMVRHETKRALRLDRERVVPLRLRGSFNFLYLLGVLGAVFLPLGWRVLAMVGIGVGSYLTTSPEIRARNRFSFLPINEVAIIFAGIFATVVPALLILEARGASLGIDRPWEFFWFTGLLSALLDNAPTYLVFSSIALGLQGMPADGSAPLLALVQSEGGAQLLRAISLGAVFMGAMTYIGNGPNFMVRSIALERKVPMPSFFGYMLWSIGILIPLFVLITMLFLRD